MGEGDADPTGKPGDFGVPEAATRRLDVTSAQTSAEPPSAVNIAADRRAHLLNDLGHLLFWLGMIAGVVLLVLIAARRGGWAPTNWQWAASWIACFGGVFLGLIAVRVSERTRRKTGFPVPPELAETASRAASAVREMHELLDMVNASTVEPQWTKKVTKAMNKQLMVVARQCELAHRAKRWHLTWMLPYRRRQAAKVSVPLHEATANVASGVLRGSEPEQ